jgi:hypothetical protein
LYISVSLRVKGFNTTRNVLRRKLSRHEIGNVRAESIQEIVQRTCRMVRAAAHYAVPHASCLAQSMALWYLFGKANIRVNLRIGGRKIAEKFEAHAWVEYNGSPLNDSPEVHQHYAAFGEEFSGLPETKT